MKRAPFLLCLLMACFYGTAQQTSIVGRLVNTAGQPLAAANMLLLNLADSSLVKGSIASDSGRFIIEKVSPGSYLLLYSMIGYKKLYSGPVLIKISDTTVNQGVVVLEEETTRLAAYTVVARKLPFEQYHDRVVVNVENMISGVGGNALEVLERSPGVSLNRQTGEISIQGRQGILILINGKLSSISGEAVMQLLESMASSTIQKIEVITNPSAKYDAQGAAGVINIITKKNENLGTQGGVSLTGGYGYYPKSAASFDISHRSRNITAFADYSVRYNGLWQDFRLNRSTNVNNGLIRNEIYNDRHIKTMVHAAKIGLEYKTGAYSSVSALASAFDNNWKMDADNSSKLSMDGGGKSDISIKDKEKNNWKHAMASLGWQKQFINGGMVNIDLDYLAYKNYNEHNNFNDYIYQNPDSTAHEQVNICKSTLLKIYVAKMDYSRTFDQKITAEGGIKFTFSHLKNDLSVKTMRNAQWFSNNTLPPLYRLTDNPVALYGNVRRQIGAKTNVQTGLRLELTNMLLTDDKDQQLFSSRVWGLFPNFSISYKPGTSSYNFSYNRRITRPSYNEIAPFVVFLDPYTYFTGNPYLKPAITDIVRADYFYRQYSFSLQYSCDKDFIASYQGKVINGTNTFYTYPANIDKQSSAVLSVNLPVAIFSWWQSMNNISVTYQRVGIDFQNTVLRLNKTKLSLFIMENLNLGKGYASEITGFYFGPSYEGWILNKSMSGVSLGLRKRLKNDKGTLSLNISDVFWGSKLKQINYHPQLNLDATFWYREEPRVVKLSYSYSFGNKKMKSVNTNLTGSEAEQNRMKL